MRPFLAIGATLALVFGAQTAVADDVAGKVVVITGATSGIGEVTAVHLASKGAKIVVSGRRKEKGEKVVAACKAAGGDAVYVKTDVSVAADVDNLFAETKAAFGGVDSVFANAGVFDTSSFLGEDGIDTIDKMININARGTAYTIRGAINALKERGGGSLVTTSSVAGGMPVGAFNMFGSGSAVQVYGATKAFIDSMTRTLLEEASNIRSYTLSPAVYQTEMSPPDPEAALGLAQAIHRHYLAVGDSQALAEIMEHLVANTTAYPVGSNIYAEGPFTYDGHVAYRDIYDPTHRGDLKNRVAVEDLRDAQGNPISATAEEVKAISDAAVAEAMAAIAVAKEEQKEL